MTFRRRLSLSIVGLILALVTAVSFVYLRYLAGMQLRFALQQAEILAEQVRSATAESAAEHWKEDGGLDTAGLQQDPVLESVVSRALGSAPTVAEIALSDESGWILLSSAGSVGRRWSSRPALRDLADGGFLTQWRAFYGTERDYEVNRALAAEGKAVLVVHVAVSSALLRRELEPAVQRLAWSVVLSLFASLALAVAFSHLVFRPLDRLGEAIDRMTKGELSSAIPEPPGKGDEYTAISSKLSLLGQQFRDAREGVSSLRTNMEQLMRKLEGAVLLFDQQNRLVIASAAAESFLGAGRWQMMGQTLEELFPAGTELGALVSSAAQLRQSLTDRPVNLPVTPEAEAGNGVEGTRPGRVLLSVESIDDFVNKRRLGTLVILRDAETRHEIASQVEISSRLAAISRLTGGVAHEIKNPLQAITLHLELLKNRLAHAEMENPPELDVIGREMARLDRVVKTFLDFTRPVDLKLSDVPLDALLAEVADLAGPEAARQRVEIHVANGCSGTLIRGDRDLLKQALLNLAVNGIQAMPNGGELRLALDRTGPDVELLVADQGVGIAPEQREKIFRLYYTTKKGGSGIGLAMTFRVIQLHNGTIEFSSEVGKGTTFRLRFPVLEAG
jgi:signal transduction histidine kinase